jgi:hypothetical protein
MFYLVGGNLTVHPEGTRSITVSETFVPKTFSVFKWMALLSINASDVTSVNPLINRSHSCGKCFKAKETPALVSDPQSDMFN